MSADIIEVLMLAGIWGLLIFWRRAAKTSKLHWATILIVSLAVMAAISVAAALR